MQANKMYRLWIARNPDFEKNGRVHLIGHSVSPAVSLPYITPTDTVSLGRLWRRTSCQINPPRCLWCLLFHDRS